MCTHFADGGRGAVELAEAVVEAAEEPSEFRLLYPSEASLREKIETIATRSTARTASTTRPTAARQLDTYERNGFGDLPICIAKTHLSISSDPSLQGGADGLEASGPRGTGLGGSGVRLPHLRRHAHHARPVVAPGRRAHRHRRERRRGRPVVSPHMIDVPRIPLAP